ncbi:MAG: HAD hydrolase-like protein [Elainellaceae cyanobacterium]
MLRIITDFDGPIMDVSPRYYHVYLHCLEEMQRPGQPLQVLPQDEFWALKRARVPERQIGMRSGLDEDQAKAFAKMRGRIVHSLPFLIHDQVIPGAIATLEQMQALSIDLAVMTMRHTCELDAAFQQYGLARFFCPRPTLLFARRLQKGGRCPRQAQHDAASPQRTAHRIDDLDDWRHGSRYGGRSAVPHSSCCGAQRNSRSPAARQTSA